MFLEKSFAEEQHRWRVPAASGGCLALRPLEKARLVRAGGTQHGQVLLAQIARENIQSV